jgi:ribonuclease BN (tRNA processing enzyme)
VAGLQRYPERRGGFYDFAPLDVGASLTLGARRITAMPADHTVPAVGYHLDSGVASMVFTGDTGPCAELWTAVNAIANLRHLIVETAFSNDEAERAVASKHLCPDTLASELAHLLRPAEIHITHLKPGQSETTMREIEQRLAARSPRMLRNGQVFEF